MTATGTAEEHNVDTIIDRLLAGNHDTSYQLFIVRDARPGKQVSLEEAEIRYLCEKSRDIFLTQPILLELEAPIKVCGIQRPYNNFLFFHR